MEATCSSEASDDRQRTTWNYVQVDTTLRILKSVWGYGLDLTGLAWGSVLDAHEHGWKADRLSTCSRDSVVWLHFEI
jgi:hypothetical protein